MAWEKPANICYQTIPTEVIVHCTCEGEMLNTYNSQCQNVNTIVALRSPHIAVYGARNKSYL